MSSSTGGALPATERLYTTKEAAALLRMTPETLERWRVIGQPGLPFVKLGTGKRAAVLYRHNDIQAFIARSVRTSTDDRGSA